MHTPSWLNKLVPLAENMSKEYKISQSKAKRFLDITISFLVIIVLSPFLTIIGLAIKLTSRGPIIFRQERCGLNNRPFTMYKFRTMVDGAEHMGLGYEVTRDDNRITGVGKLLRSASLDELPQLANIIKGDMSLIGPRPMTAKQIVHLNPKQMCRQQARPGISGWAQVNGRNALDWEKRLELDTWYVENWALLLDLAILWKTIPTVIRRDGLYGVDGVNKTIG